MTVSLLLFLPLSPLLGSSRVCLTRFSRRKFKPESLQCCLYPSIAPPSASLLPISPTPLTPITFRGQTIFVKRDDQLNFAGVTGSKLRKFHSLFTDPAFDEADHVVSYGGAQSNAMLALARLCHYRHKPFVYITRSIPSRLSESPGNFRDALDVGMHHVQLDHDTFRQTFTDTPPDTIRNTISSILANVSTPFPTQRALFVPQGGAWHGAEPGIERLADELRVQLSELRERNLLSDRRPVIFLPSGTGATALYLQKHIEDVAKVVAVPVSGSEIYLIKQMRWLQAYHARHGDTKPGLALPNVLRPRLRASFADVRLDKLHIWQELERAADGQFAFDLIYAPKAWEEVMLAVQQGRIANKGEDLVYYHTGGVEGNVSMLDRFKRKGFLT